MIGGQDLLGIETDMRCIGAQESGDVGGARQLVEATFLDGFEIRAANPQALLDFGQSEASRFTLVAQQSTNSAAR